MKNLRICILPDIMQHDMQHVMEKSRGFSYENIISEDIIKILDSCDLVIGNFETVCSNLHEISGFPKFNSHPNLLKELAKYVDVLCLANNHIYDHGRVGLASTINNVESNDIMYVGVFAQNFLNFEVNGQKIVIHNFTDLSNCEVNDIEVSQKLRESKIKDDEIGILFVHSGDEYKSEFTERQQEIESKAKELGYSMCIQIHSHVIGDQNQLIGHNFYSTNGMGNFLSWQKLTSNDGCFRILTIDCETKDIKNYVNFDIKTEILGGHQQVVLK